MQLSDGSKYGKSDDPNWRMKLIWEAPNQTTVVKREEYQYDMSRLFEGWYAVFLT